MIVKIQSFIDAGDTTVEEATEKALSSVADYDRINEDIVGETLVTKLYYILPISGKIIVVVNDADRDILGVQSNVLAVTNISEYPFAKLPSSIIEYKELIVTVESTRSDLDVLNAAQFIADDAAVKSLPFKIPVVKIIDYRKKNGSQLVLSSIFGDNVFAIGERDTTTTLINSGDAEAGSGIINQAKGTVFSNIQLEVMKMNLVTGAENVFCNTQFEAIKMNLATNTGTVSSNIQFEAMEMNLAKSVNNVIGNIQLEASRREG